MERTKLKPPEDHDVRELDFDSFRTSLHLMKVQMERLKSAERLTSTIST
jgi:hypothetical protein